MTTPPRVDDLQTTSFKIIVAYLNDRPYSPHNMLCMFVRRRNPSHMHPSVLEPISQSSATAKFDFNLRQ